VFLQLSVTHTLIHDFATISESDFKRIDLRKIGLVFKIASKNTKIVQEVSALFSPKCKAVLLLQELK
jgi:hypothetical protein